MTQDVTKGDIARIHDKIDSLSKETNEAIKQLTVEMTRLVTTVSHLGEAIHAHLKEHRDTRKAWQGQIIAAIVRLGYVALIGLFGVWISTKLKG